MKDVNLVNIDLKEIFYDAELIQEIFLSKQTQTYLCWT